MSEQKSLLQVCDQLGIVVERNGIPEQLAALEQEINRLLFYDFDKLIAILYRVDVSEQKLKQLLKDKPGEDAAKLIASLLIERQEQKIRTREQSSSTREDISDEERW